MYKIVYFLLISIIFFSCNSTSQNQKNEVVDQNRIIDTISIIDNNSNKQMNIDTINVDFEYYVSAIKLTKDTISDYKKFKLKDFTYLKSDQTQFKYYILTELKFHDTFKSYLIAGDYESEQSCWIVNYSDNNSLLSSYEVYYDNAEGAWSTTSKINEHDKLIKIKTYDTYRNLEEMTDSLIIDRSGKFIKL